MEATSSQRAAAVAAAVLAGSAAGALAALWWYRPKNWSRFVAEEEQNGGGVKTGLLGLVGNTPLIRIQSLSEATGCEILGKAEFMNPGGSVKDRVAVRIIQEALESGALRAGGLITEGSAGSTGVSLAMVALAYGCKCHVVIPDDAAIEKAQLLEALEAVVERVRPVSITHKDHFVNIARLRAQEADMTHRRISDQSPESGLLDESSSVNLVPLENDINEVKEQSREQTLQEIKLKERQNKGGFFADQFENLANFRAHYEGTGPEIWNQTDGSLHAFVAAAGTGGTIAGVSCFLKEQKSSVKCYLIDPPGSGLFNRVARGVMYSRQESEGKRLKNPFDTITEGIGINRLTENFKLAQLDGAFQGTDREAVEMSRGLQPKVKPHARTS